MAFDGVTHMMSRDATTSTAAHETKGARMTLDRCMTGVHHRDVEIIVTTYAFHYGRFQRHEKKEAAIVAMATVRAISTTIAAIEDRRSGSNDEHHAVTHAKPHSISRLRGARVSLDTA